MNILGHAQALLKLALLIFIALGVLTLSWLPIGFAQTSLLAFVCGVILLDFAVQAVHVTRQNLTFAARPDAQSCMVGAYMYFYSIGSASGAVAATQTYVRAGDGVR